MRGLPRGAEPGWRGAVAGLPLAGGGRGDRGDPIQRSPGPGRLQGTGCRGCSALLWAPLRPGPIPEHRRGMQDPTIPSIPKGSTPQPCRVLQDPVPSIPNPRKVMQDPVPSVSNPHKVVQDPIPSIPNPRKVVQDPVPSVPNPHKVMQDPIPSIPKPCRVMRDPVPSVPKPCRVLRDSVPPHSKVL